MGQEQLNDLALMSREREELEAINRGKIMENFVETNVKLVKFKLLANESFVKIWPEKFWETGGGCKSKFYPRCKRGQNCHWWESRHVLLHLSTMLDQMAISKS